MAQAKKKVAVTKRQVKNILENAEKGAKDFLAGKLLSGRSAYETPVEQKSIISCCGCASSIHTYGLLAPFSYLWSVSEVWW